MRTKIFPNDKLMTMFTRVILSEVISTVEQHTCTNMHTHRYTHLPTHTHTHTKTDLSRVVAAAERKKAFSF